MTHLTCAGVRSHYFWDTSVVRVAPLQENVGMPRLDPSESFTSYVDVSFLKVLLRKSELELKSVGSCAKLFSLST